MKTSPTNKKIREIMSMVREGKLIPRPEFQRRLVWSSKDKNHFLDSVLRGYPFPEIYLADGEVDLETGEGTQLLVDGLQRVSTLIQYFEGDAELRLASVPLYRSLSEEKKKLFLQYDVAVRDLGPISKDQIIDVFRRLNATKYSLNDIEVNNAVYAGALKQFCERVSENDFFRRHSVFNALDYKRMGDLRYVLGIVGTMLQGYFNRDDVFEELLERYNDEFPEEKDLLQRLDVVFAFVDECGFDERSRVWNKSDLFTLVVEIDQCLNFIHTKLQPEEVLNGMTKLYDATTSIMPGNSEIGSMYHKTALQASNDKINRIRRGRIVSGVLMSKSFPEIIDGMKKEGLA